MDIDYRCTKCDFTTTSEDKARKHHNPDDHVMEYKSSLTGKWEMAFDDRL